MTEPQQPDLIPADADVELPLSVVIDRFAGDLPRDRDLVRRFARWWAERAGHIRLKFLNDYPTESALVAFRMEHEVRMVVTGWIPGEPVDLTFNVHEDDFPRVLLVLSAEPSAQPVSLAVLDYACRDRAFTVTRDHEAIIAGATGTGECLMEVDGQILLRGNLDGGGRVQLPDDVFAWAP